MEHRWGRRFVVDIPVYMTAANATSMNRAQLANLSITGALIKSEFRPRVLSRVQIVFGLPGRQGQELSIAAYVTQNYRHGIGVEWCELAPPVVTELVRTASAQSPSLQYASVVDSAHLPNPSDPNNDDLRAKSLLFTQWIANMNALLDGTNAPQCRSLLEASGLSWTQSVQQKMVAIRHARIALLAYSMAEKRGFESGHDTDDWLRAQSELNAQDAGTSPM